MLFELCADSLDNIILKTNIIKKTLSLPISLCRIIDCSSIFFIINIYIIFYLIIYLFIFIFKGAIKYMHEFEVPFIHRGNEYISLILCFIL